MRVMKLRIICKSKIHHAVVTGADLNYIGSIGIDETLMRLTGIERGEQVAVWNVNNGQRIETYALPLAEGSGQGGLAAVYRARLAAMQWKDSTVRSKQSPQ